MERRENGFELCVVDKTLAARNIVEASLTAPLVCHAAPMVRIDRASPRLVEFEQQEMARRLREEEDRLKREREWQRIQTD